MRTRLLVIAAAAVAAVALVAGGAYLYYFTGLRTSPPQLGLTATPAATPTAGGSTPTASAGLSGSWTVASGSVAGYRVKELFVGQTSKHEAVARTSTVSGGLTVSSGADAYQVSNVTITVGLAGLESKDQVAGRDVTQRDGVVSRQLDVSQFPTATFSVVSASVPSAVTSGPVDVTAAGKLTIHGVTRDVTVKAKAQLAGSRVEIAGSIAINMADYGVSPPQVPFVTVDTALTLEFDIFMTRTT